MPLKRMTAKKVRIFDIMNGTWVKKEGMEPSYGDQLSRVRIIGTVVSKFIAEDNNFASITVDDGTDTLRAKTFKTAKPIDVIELGNLVEIIAKVREYNEEVYVIPEIVMKIEDPNLEILRKIEIYSDLKKRGVSMETKIEITKPAPMQPASPPPQQTNEEPKKEEGDDLRRQVMEKIEGSTDGISYTDITSSMSANEEDIESVINDLLSEGICYEPTPGKIRKI
jgi:RPA family protein